METNKKTNVYEIITKQILGDMMNGIIPWRDVFTLSKKNDGYVNNFTGKPYSFLNCMLLGRPGRYASFKQIKDKKGHIKKGARGRMVIYWGSFIPKDRKEEEKRLLEEGKSTEHLKVYFPKYYYVYHMDDVEGIPVPKMKEPEHEKAESPTLVANLMTDGYTAAEGVKVKNDDTCEPAYDIATDTVTLPSKPRFQYEEDYYAALFRELVHSTAVEQRCNRTHEAEKLADRELTVKEELIAEIGSSMLLSLAGLKKKEPRQQVSASCQRWITELNRDYRLIFRAAYSAEKAVKLIAREFMKDIAVEDVNEEKLEDAA